MKMKKLSLLIALFLVFNFSIRAQTNTDAQSILNKAAEKIQSSKGINVNFSFTQKDKSGAIVSVSKGEMKIKGTKYYIKQNKTEIYCNGVQMWNYDGENEVTVAKAGDEDEFSPEKILTGFNAKDFTIKLASSTSTGYQIQLVPVDKRKNFKHVILYINKSTNLVSKAIITDKTGAAIEINFSNIALNASFPDSHFVFDANKHPGVEIVNQ
jgi:outer membrane lipoprotein carrier protein